MKTLPICSKQCLVEPTQISPFTEILQKKKKKSKSKKTEAKGKKEAKDKKNKKDKSTARGWISQWDNAQCYNKLTQLADVFCVHLSLQNSSI